MLGIVRLIRVEKLNAADFVCNVPRRWWPKRWATKKGPGLQGLFKNPKLPKTGRPTSEKSIRETLVNGGEKMPPFKHLKDQEIKAIIDYLKSL